MEKNTARPDTHITGQHALLQEMLGELLGEQGAFQALMRLTRAGGEESLLTALGPLVRAHAPGRMDDMLGHNGLCGEFGNGIGTALMWAKARRDRADHDPAQLPADMERIRYYWRDKLSKATEYTSKAEVGGEAMKRYGREFRAFIDTHPVPPALHARISAQLDTYDRAIGAVESLVSTLERTRNGPQTLAGKDAGRQIVS